MRQRQKLGKNFKGDQRYQPLDPGSPGNPSKD